MRYNIIGKNIDVWDKTKEMVEKKLDRIEKLFPEDTNATITSAHSPQWLLKSSFLVIVFLPLL